MGQVYGYGRVSTLDQNPDLQMDALTAAGAERLFIERASGRLAARPELERLRAALLPGDVVVVWKLDRIGRSTKDLIDIVLTDLAARNVGFKSVTEAIDTTTASGRFFFQVLAALAEFEHALIVERTKDGLAAARARGRKGGRPPALSEQQQELARQLYDTQAHTVQQIADMYGVSRATIYKAFAGGAGRPRRGRARCPAGRRGSGRCAVSPGTVPSCRCGAGVQ